MKAFVNLPDSNKNELLMSQVADFRATLMLEKINKLNYNDAAKEKILSLVLNHFKT